MGVGQKGATTSTSTSTATSAPDRAGPGAEELAGAQTGSPAEAGAAEEVTVRSAEALNLEFELAVEVIYHRSREAWLMQMHRVMLFGTILAGTVAATDVVGAKFVAVIAASCGALDLVADFVSAATAHRDIARDYLGVVAGLVRDDFSAAACGRARDEHFRISATEPPTFRAAQELAYNRAVDSLDRDTAAKVAVPFSRRWLAHIRQFAD